MDFDEQRYRREREACSAEFLSALAAAGGVLSDPAARLRYFHAAIESYAARDREVQQLLPFKPLRTWYYRVVSQSALAAVAPHAGRSGGTDPRAHLVHALAWLSQHLGPVVWVTALLVIAGAGPWIALKLRSPAPAVPVVIGPTPAVPQDVKPVAVPETPTGPMAEDMVKPALGIAPNSVWLVERGPDWELYSNGLRIETSYLVQGKPRRFQIHDFPSGNLSTARSAPAGILFHTTESDVWPLEPDFNNQIRRSTTSLLRYIARQKIYHYVIDRFGRVFRIVADETVANHAGNSVWTQGNSVYLNLNGAFIGVAFETQWEGGRTLPITRAQLEAGHRLTDQLRQRYAIPADMCVTHGLTSVNPRWHLIGHHRDWARGFPFEALGLPNLYAEPVPAVALFGFTYDREFLEAVGAPWAGLAAAEQRFAAAASAQGLSVSDLRQQRFALYDLWYSHTRGNDESLAESRALDGS